MANIKKCKVTGCYADAVVSGLCANCAGSRLPDRKREYTTRNPLPKGRLLSLEIEAICGNSSGYKAGTNCALCCSDGSLQGSYTGEFKIVAPGAAKLSRLASSLARKLITLGWSVNNSCGLHLGVDVRELDHSRLEAVFRYLYASQDFWFSLVPPARRSNNYCRKLRYPDISCSHYDWANVSLQGRVEVRIHPGTLNPHKLLGWIDCWGRLQERFHDPSFMLTTIDPVSGATIATPIRDMMPRECKGARYLNDRHQGNGILRSTDRAITTGSLTDGE